MTLLSTIAEFVGKAVGAAIRSARMRPYWRWGHGYPAIEGVYTCVYCGRVDVFRSRVTSPPCPGPKTKETP